MDRYDDYQGNFLQKKRKSFGLLNTKKVLLIYILYLWISLNISLYNLLIDETILVNLIGNYNKMIQPIQDRVDIYLMLKTHFSTLKYFEIWQI